MNLLKVYGACVRSSDTGHYFLLLHAEVVALNKTFIIEAICQSFEKRTFSATPWKKGTLRCSFRK